MQDYTGEIRLFAGQRARSGWVFCEGQALGSERYSHLAPLLGESSGKLNVPDLSAIQPDQHIRFMLCTRGLFPALSDSAFNIKKN